MELDSSDAEAAISLSYSVLLNGRPAEALPLFENAYRLYAIVPPAPHSYLAECYRQLGRLDEAADTIHRVRDQYPELYVPHLFAALVYGHRGDSADAKNALQSLLDIEPTYSLKRIPLLLHYRERERVNEAVDILRNVGLPE